MQDGKNDAADCATALSLARYVMEDPKATEEQRRRAAGIVSRCEARLRQAEGTLGFAAVPRGRA